MTNTKPQRNCPNCNKIILYSNSSNFKRAIRKNSVCKSCCPNKGKFKHGQTPHNLGKPHSDTAKAKIRLARSKQVITEDQKRKLRIAAINDRLIKYGHSPNYNPTACQLINEYGCRHGYAFQHAENGGELHIKELGYFVDGYDVNKNVVIEVYEKRWHTDREHDRIRKEQIIQHLNCEFIELWIE